MKTPRRLPPSLTILLAWIVASVILIVLLLAVASLAYARGLDDGVQIGTVRTLHKFTPSRAALDARTYVWPRGAALDATRIRRYLRGVSL